MDWLTVPFEASFVTRALWGGLLVSAICALVGTWVVLRGMAFLGEAMSHGMLPGVAVAALLGGSLFIGGALAAATMAVGVTALSRSSRLTRDTAIGLFFVGMLSAGVVIVSHSESFAVDLTAFLFGDVLSVRPGDLVTLGIALFVVTVVTIGFHRAFVALAFDERKAATLGLRPRLANLVLIGLLTVAIAASFHVVGTLLVFGLLIGPPAAMAQWASRLPTVMIGAIGIGAVATVAGLLVSWHFETAAGATIALLAVSSFFASAVLSGVWSRIRRIDTERLA